MCRPAEVHDDEGFSLVEVMVSMLIFAVIAVTSLAMITNALGATALGRMETVAKTAGQQRLESMRNLPYSINATVSNAPDLLDTYFTSTSTTAAGTAATGYVPLGGARDVRRGDPPTGHFFRRVFPQGTVPGAAQVEQRVTTQFMRTENEVLADPVFVSGSTTQTGLPPAATVAVRVTTIWRADGRERISTVYSQIAEGAARPPLVTLQGRLSMLRVSGQLPAARELVVEAGGLSVDGSLTQNTVASSIAQGAFAAIADSLRVDGARETAAAPATVVKADRTVDAQTLNDGAALVAQLSRTSVRKVGASTTGGQPGAGTTTDPVTSVLLGGDAFSEEDLMLSADTQPDTTSRLRLAAGPTVRVVSGDCDDSCQAVFGRGVASSTGGGTHDARVRLTGGTSTSGGGTELRLLPTTTSPQGLVRVRLSSFSLSCQAGAGITADAVPTYTATVQYRTYNPVTGTYGYQSAGTLSADNTSDPLAAVPLTQQVGVDAMGLPLLLSDYIASWSSLTKPAWQAARQVASNGTSASIAFPGVFTLSSKALRTEAESTVGVQLAAASCVAGDVR